MKLLLITTTFPTPLRPRQGAFNHVLVEALSRRHEVRVIAPIPWVQKWRNLSQPASFDDARIHPTYFYPPRIARTLYHHFYWYSIAAALRQLNATFQPEAVIGYWSHPDGTAAVKAAANWNVPCLLMSGGSDLRLLAQQPRRRKVIAETLKQADRVLLLSRELVQHACALGVAPERCDVLYRGVDKSCFFPQDRAAARHACGLSADARVVFWAGRLEAVKNPQLLLSAAKHWRTKFGPQMQVLVAGDGPLRRKLWQQRQRLELEQTVRFEGSLTATELCLRYNAADLTVLTSHSEGVPNVLLESIACGTPFVATNVGGVAEIATAGVDRLVAADDPQALAAAVIAQLETPRCGERGFVPSDLDGMVDRFDASLARLFTAGPTPFSCPPPGYHSADTRMHSQNEVASSC